jgi:hypothetical protein
VRYDAWSRRLRAKKSGPRMSQSRFGSTRRSGARPPLCHIHPRPRGPVRLTRPGRSRSFHFPPHGRCHSTLHWLYQAGPDDAGTRVRHHVQLVVSPRLSVRRNRAKLRSFPRLRSRRAGCCCAVQCDNTGRKCRVLRHWRDHPDSLWETELVRLNLRHAARLARRKPIGYNHFVQPELFVWAPIIDRLSAITKMPSRPGISP